MEMISDSTFSDSALAAYARDSRLPSRELANGLCFHASVELARQAQVLQVQQPLRFVRWRVRDDLQFHEHWALLVGDAVIDLTAVQVDGDDEPFRSLHSYPGNYTDRREYPLHVVLAPVQTAALRHGQRYPRGILWAVNRRMAAFDLLRAVRQRSPAAVITASRHMAGAAFTLVAGYLLEAAIQRLGRLLLRLH